MVLWLMACAGEAETGSSDVVDLAADSGAGTVTVSDAESPWSLKHFALLSGSTGWRNGEPTDYTVDGEVVQPSIRFGFFSEAFILGLSDAAWCEGVAAMELTEEPSSDGRWLTFSADLTLAETDCTEDWADGSPADRLDGSSLTIALTRYEPLDEAHLADVLEPFEGSVYLLQFLGTPNPMTLGYGTIAATSGDEMIVEDGQVQLLPISDSIQDGVLRWHAVESLDVDILDALLTQ